MRTIHRAALAIGCLVLAAFQLAGTHPGNIDDAFIVLVYARRLASGQPLAWNVADGRVDGFTSVLDLVVKAGATRLWPGDDFRTAWLLALVFEIGAIAIALRFAFKIAGSSRRGAVPGALLALAIAGSTAIAEGQSFVLETTLYVALALAALHTVIAKDDARPKTLAIFSAQCLLLSLARPEGILLALVLSFCFFVTRRGAAPERTRIAPLIAAGTIVGAYLGWHLSYFGYVAPNTFYAKASDSRVLEIQDGLAYVADFALSPGTLLLAVGFVLAPVAAALGAEWEDPQARRSFAVAAIAATTSALSVVLGGGDGYRGARFLAAPAALLLVAIAIAATGMRARGRKVALAVLSLAVAQSLVLAFGSPLEKMSYFRDWPLSRKSFPCDADVTAVLHRLGVTSFAETDYQRLKYYDDDVRVIDLTGLNDRAIAHRPHPGQNLWGKVDLATAPRTGAEALQIGPRFVTDVPLGRFSTAALFDNPKIATLFFGRPLPREARPAYVGAYVTAGFPVCGGDVYFDVLLRSDVAERAHLPGSAIGGQPTAP